MSKRDIGQEILDSIREIRAGKVGRVTVHMSPAEIKQTREKLGVTQEKEVERLRAQVVSEWQPIETAPKFELVLLWWPDVTNAPLVGYQVHGVWRTDMRGDTWPDLPGPTHWMPLPKPPASTHESR